MHFNLTTGIQNSKAFLKSINISYLDLHEIFKKNNFERHDIYWRYDGHFSDRGNQIVGQILARELSEKPFFITTH